MSTLLLNHADVVITMDTTRREIKDGAVWIRDGVIEAVGSSAELAMYAAKADEVINMTGRIVLPGLINTHHHMYQSLTRAIPGAQ